MSEPCRVAFFGGSFDPPHIGHLLVGAYVLGSYPVDELCVVPTYAHRFKDSTAASFDERCEMARLAFSELRRASISALESELGEGPSLTLRSLEEMARRRPGIELRLVLGTDLRAEVERWHRFDRIVELAPPIWVARQGCGDGADEVAIPNINSTEIRHKLARTESTSGLLHPRVARFIEERGLYRPGS